MLPQPTTVPVLFAYLSLPVGRHCSHIVHVWNLVLESDDGNILVQCLLRELSVSDHSSTLAPECLGVSRLSDEVITQANSQCSHILLAHVSNTVSSCEDVFFGDERSTTELSPILQQSSNPGPLTLVSWPTIDHLEWMLMIQINPLLFLRHHSLLIVLDGSISSNSTGLGVA